MEEILKLLQLMWARLKLKLRPYTITMVNSTQTLIVGPCIVGNIAVTGDGAAGTVDIYDGVNAHAEHKYNLVCLNSTTFATGAAQDHLFNYGIHVVVNESTTYAMVTFKPLRHEEVKALRN